MKRKRHTPEQIISKLRDADAMLAGGSPIAQIVQQLGVSEQTYHRWRTQYGGMKASDAKKALKAELKRMGRFMQKNPSFVYNSAGRRTTGWSGMRHLLQVRGGNYRYKRR